MNRSTAAAVAVAAVLGVTGGTWVGATLGSDDDPSSSDTPDTAGPSTGNTGKKTPTSPPTSASTPAQLLYMDATTIHDGYTHVPVEGFTLSEVDALVRLRGGWLVIERAQGEPTFDATRVDVTGERTDLGTFLGSWDISIDGDLFVGLKGGDYTVLDLTTGDAIDLEVQAPEDSNPSGDLAFGVNSILTGWLADDGTTRSTVRTDLTTGRSRAVQTGTLTSWTASPGGLLIAGRVSNGAITCLRGGAVTDSNRWTACDWALDESRPKYSPNGEQLLVVPLDPDAGPPETYGVLASGSGVLIVTIDAPALAVDAEWGDNNEVFVLARKTPRSPANTLYRCQVNGECVLERPGEAPLFLGVGV